eukprot:72287-Hanusia_phi.AAC.1
MKREHDMSERRCQESGTSVQTAQILRQSRGTSRVVLVTNAREQEENSTRKGQDKIENENKNKVGQEQKSDMNETQQDKKRPLSIFLLSSFPSGKKRRQRLRRRRK